MVTGSSWTTAGTLGVAFVGMAPSSASTTIAAGAVISGAYFGDKMSPLSETTILVPSSSAAADGQPAHAEHVLDGRAGVRRSASSLFLVLGRVADPDAAISTDEARDVAGRRRSTSRRSTCCRWSLLVVLAVLRMPPFLAILGSALFAGVLAPFIQWDAVEAFVDDPSLGTVATGIEGHLRGHGHRLRQRLRRAPDRRPVLARRHGQHADHDLAGPRRALLRRRHGARRLPAAAARADRVPRPPTRLAHRRRSTPAASGSTSSPATSTSPTSCRRGCSAPSSPAAAWRPRCCPGPSRTPARSRRPGAVEQLRRLHVRRARRPDRRVPPVLLLQPAQPAARHRLRLPRLQGAPARRRPGRTTAADRHDRRPHHRRRRRHG